MDKNVLDTATSNKERPFVLQLADLSPEEQHWRVQVQQECAEQRLAGLIAHMVKLVQDGAAPETALKRLQLLQQDLDGKGLVALLEKLLLRFDLSINGLAVSAEIDPSLLSKIMRGESRLFEQEKVDILLEDLCYGEQPGNGMLFDFMELLAWHNALRIAAANKEEMDKVLEKRLAKVPDAALRKKVKEEYLRSQSAHLKKSYWETLGQFPALVPFVDALVAQMMKKWDWIKVPPGYELRQPSENRYDLIAVDLFPKKITSLGPGLRVKDTGFGTYTVYRETPKPVLPQLKQAEEAAPEPPKEPVESQKQTEHRPARRTSSYIEPELIHIPAGPFWMGSDDSDKDTYDSEKPRHQVTLAEYWIARTPVTNEEYRCFLLASPNHRKPNGWQGFDYPSGKANHPVVNVYWDDAVAYCRWLAQITGKDYRLPSEAEWEKAARGTDARFYPWGNKFDKDKCNTYESRIGTTTPVGKYSPQGDSPYGCMDMSGNVWEWTRSHNKPYPYNAADGREDLQAGNDVPRVLRGGSFSGDSRLARCSYRDRLSLVSWYVSLGFRVGVFAPIHL